MIRSKTDGLARVTKEAMHIIGLGCKGGYSYYPCGCLQGVLTSNEVQEILKVRGWQGAYPLFTTISHIINGTLPPTYITNYAVCCSMG